MTTLLQRLGLGRPELRAWAMYDWANSAYPDDHHRRRLPHLLLQKVAAADLPGGRGDQPVRLGDDHRHPDRRARRAAPRRDRRLRRHEEEDARHVPGDRRGLRPRRCTSSRAATGSSRCVLFVIGNVGVAGSIVFYDSLLPHLVSEDELDRVSTAGYAIGYLGGGVLLAINLLMMSKPGWFGLPAARIAVRLSLASVACLVGRSSRFRSSAGVPEPAQRLESGRTAWRQRVRHRRPPADRDVPGAAPLQAGVPAAPGLPRLQRRHPDDHPDGDDLRHRDRDRRERDDQRRS